MEKYKGREIDYTKPVRVYRNLNKKGQVYSIQQNGVVVAHTKEFVLKDVKFIINKAGKERAIKTKTRNVHAFIEGYLGDIDDVLLEFSHILKYQPFDKKGFYTSSYLLREASVVYKMGNDLDVKVQL